MAGAKGAIPETALYEPVKRLLQGRGFEVKGEVGACDVVARNGDGMVVVVELKRSFGIALLLQAVERLALTDNVYVAVPARRGRGRAARAELKLLRMLGLGFIEVVLRKRAPYARVLLDPDTYRPRVSSSRRARLLAEFTRRVGDPMAGGRDRRAGLLTAYRQRALSIAGYLAEHGPTKAALVADAVAEPTARQVLYGDVYGWFERRGRGVYALSPLGAMALTEWVPPAHPTRGSNTHHQQPGGE